MRAPSTVQSSTRRAHLPARPAPPPPRTEPVNDAPAVHPPTYATDEDTNIEEPAGHLLTFVNDIDNTPDQLRVLADEGQATEAGGTVTIRADGGFTYEPKPNYNGPDSFEFTVTDGTHPVTTTATIAVGGWRGAHAVLDPAARPARRTPPA